MVLLPYARLFALFFFALCVTSGPVRNRALIPLTPDKDPWYQPPPGFESAQPGTILRTRTIIPSIFGIIPALNVKTYQLLYRTTAIDGSAIVETVTVFKPIIGAKTDRFVSFQTAYDGSSTICNPSYEYQLLTAQVDLFIQVEVIQIEAFLLAGYIVSSSDYEGPDAAFGAGRLAGMGVLDSMRAVKNFKQTLGFSTENPSIVGYGYSGGAIATGWAGSLVSSYASELEGSIKGWVQGGTPANLTGTGLNIDNTFFSGFVPAAIAGVRKPTAYGAQLKPFFDSILTPYGQEIVAFTERNCIADLFNFFEKSVLSKDFQSLGDRLFYHPTFASVFNKNIMGVEKSETPKAPVYIFHAVNDEIMPYSNASTLVNSWCNYGANVQFVTYTNGGHFATTTIAFADVFKWVQSAFAGNIPSGCSRSTKLDNMYSPIALGAALEPALTRLVDQLAKIGKDDSNILANPKLLQALM